MFDTYTDETSTMSKSQNSPLCLLLFIMEDTGYIYIRTFRYRNVYIVDRQMSTIVLSWRISTKSTI